MASSSSSWLQPQDDDNDASTNAVTTLFSSIPRHLQTILQDNHDALMAPFIIEKENAMFLDDNPGSNYVTCTTPQERYHHYRGTLTERMALASNLVRRVLQSLYDYVTHYVVTQQREEEM